MLEIDGSSCRSVIINAKLLNNVELILAKLKNQANINLRLSCSTFSVKSYAYQVGGCEICLGMLSRNMTSNCWILSNNCTEDDNQGISLCNKISVLSFEVTRRLVGNRNHSKPESCITLHSY